MRNQLHLMRLVIVGLADLVGLSIQFIEAQRNSWKDVVDLSYGRDSIDLDIVDCNEAGYKVIVVLSLHHYRHRTLFSDPFFSRVSSLASFIAFESKIAPHASARSRSALQPRAKSLQDSMMSHQQPRRPGQHLHMYPYFSRAVAAVIRKH
jgi:hypothetical protein